MLKDPQDSRDKVELKCVAKFLIAHWDGKSPLLLGYSGGPDSKALLYAMLEAGCQTLHLAHVDHGWRPESAQEALKLEEEAKILGLPFHSIRLNPSEKNKEAVSREARLSFFRSLFDIYPFQALLLAHQAGDVAETALKRMLEGAHLPFLGGMEPMGKLHGMSIWRPLFSTKKEEVLAFLEKKNLRPLSDSTNFDPAFLRARMRIEILPLLAKSFGKEISDNLLLLAERASELKAYLEKKTESYAPHRGPWGLFGHLRNFERLEARFFLQKWAEIEKIHLTRTLLESALDTLESNRPNGRIAPRVIVDRGAVFFLSAAPPSWGKDPLLLRPGLWTWGDWEINVTEEEAPKEDARSSWKNVWSGHFTVRASPGFLCPPSLQTPFRRLWNECKVPAFFRYQVPIFSTQRGAFNEFLSGKNLPEIESCFKLTFSTLFTNCSLPTS